MKESSLPFILFIVPSCQFEFKKLPFGLSTAPVGFQMALTKFIGDIQDVSINLVDILIGSENEQEHAETLSEILERLKKHSIRIKFKKSEFFTKEITFIGHKISEGTVKADLTKYNSSKLEVQPKTHKELKKRIGYLNRYRDYVFGLSIMTVSFYEKFKQRNFCWSNKDEVVLKKVKEMIEKQQSLTIPEMGKDFSLFMDAFDQ